MAESLFILPFGKYKNVPIEDVPISYLNYLLEQDWFCDKFSNKVSLIQKEISFRERFSDEEPIDKNWNRR